MTIPQRGITSYKSVGYFLLDGSQRDMQSAIMPQPFPVGDEADWYAIQVCRLAVLPSGCGTSLDHGALTAGCGTVNGSLPGWEHVGCHPVRALLPLPAIASHPCTAHGGACQSSFTAAIPHSGVTGYQRVGNLLVSDRVCNM